MNECKTCKKPTVSTPSGIAHIGGGMVEQKCNTCGWKGGQIGNFSQCPSCGDKTGLMITHAAN